MSDIEAGRAAGIGRCFLVRTGHSLTDEVTVRADGTFDDLLACAKGVLAPARGSI
ncbi:MAG: hypothetical protein ACRETJ_01150 [Steroidobacteraceae bacterium]